MSEHVDRTCRDDATIAPLPPSVLEPGAAGSDREDSIEEHVSRTTRARLASRLLNESPIAELAHLLLIGIVACIIWGRVPNLAVYLWVAAVAIATCSRFFLRRHLCSSNEEPERIYRSMRVVVLLSGLAWGVGALLLAGWYGHEELALIVIVFAGLVAGATSTLVADRPSFYLFAGSALFPLIVGILITGSGRFHIFAVILIGLSGLIMSVIYKRSHEQIVGHLEANARLQLSDILLETERDRMRTFFEQAPIAIAMVDRESVILDINPGFTNIFGYEREEAVGADLNLLVVPEEELEQAREYDRQVAATEVTVVETRRRSKSGELVPVLASAIHSGAEGEPLTFIIYNDISGIKETQRALAEVEEQYRTLVESASDMVWEVDAEGKWTFLNRAAEDLLGVRREVLLGRPFVDSMDPTVVKDGVQRFRGVLEGEGLIDYETVFLDADGEARHLSFAAQPIRDVYGHIRGARGIARDVTERVAAREALEEARRSAEEMARARTSFLANMSHEIRTPMNGILGMTELLLDSDLTPEQRTEAELIRTSADALLRVINDILDFSKIESGQFDIEEIAFDLHAVVDSTLRTFVVPAFEKDLELISDIHPGVPVRVMGDPGRLRQILNNLVGNAVKFTPSGEIAISVTQTSAPDGKELLRFSVKDTGIGIPEGKLEQIFEEFSQADVSTTREYGGTGLGLAISKRIVELMGGTLEVASTVGEGSTFSFTIPFQACEESKRVGAVRERIGLKGRRVLVVDDNATNRRIVREMLGTVGIVTDEAREAKRGLAMLREAASMGESYDLVIIDGYMPGMDGFELATVIRSDNALDDVRTMLLTSGARKGDGQRCRDIGVDGYLTKPVARVDLLEAIHVILTDRKERSPVGDLVTRHSIEESRQHRRILLAEDNPVNQMVASTMLRKRGHAVDVVGNGQEAIEAVRNNAYDIVLMDIQMPVMDGIAAVGEIRSDPRLADLPVIALTAHALEGDEERFIEAGMNGYLSKPFRPHELFAVVEQWTDDRIGSGVGNETAEAAGPPVDLGSFRETMREAGAEDAVESMLELFRDDAPERIEALREAADGGDVETIAKAAHAYKSAAATIGATRLAATLSAIERSARENDLEGATGRVGEAERQHHEALDYIRTRME